MKTIENRLFLIIQCRSIDFLLRFSIILNEWLTTFVAIERVFIIIKGINFNKNKSQLFAKWIITGLILLIILTIIMIMMMKNEFGILLIIHLLLELLI